jgi:lipid II:glycine glycyltransferase (peptidoglycan interpeptide bridge formation enzyme)
MELQVTVQQTETPSLAQRDEWDRLVDGTPGTDVTQLSAWADLRVRVGYRPLYLFAYSGGRLVGGALVLRRRLAGVVRIGYLPYGPVLAEGLDDRAPLLDALVDALVRVARPLQMMFVQPPESADDVSAALLERGFRPSTAGIAPNGSYRIDLAQDLERIRCGFSKRLKSWTNRWGSKGVVVRRGDETDLPLLAGLMARSGARQGFTPPPLEYIEALYRGLAADGRAALFVGEVNGVAVSADVVTICGGMVRGRLGGFDGSGEAGKLSVPAAVRWQIIQWAKGQGLRYLDFGGLPERMLADMIDRGIRTSDDWPNAQRGKLAFNGTPFRYPTAVELIRPGLLRASYDLAARSERGQRLVRSAKVVLRRGRGR